jgi:uncharacterized protein DUF1707/2TM domain-containing protein
MDTLDHRASDAEREATAERLRVAAGDGRLDPEELEQRLDAAYSAKTVGELTALTRDLPAPPPAGAPPERRWDSQAVRARLASFVVVNTICIAIWAATGANGGFWPIWVILGTGIGLFAAVVRRTLGVEEEEPHHRHGRRHLDPPRRDA